MDLLMKEAMTSAQSTLVSYVEGGRDGSAMPLQSRVGFLG